MVVEGLFYTKEHVWAKVKGDIVTMGVTDYARKVSEHYGYVKLPFIGEEFHSHETIALLEAEKATFDVYSPVTGKVVEVNSRLDSDPELITKDCYKKGWICRLKTTDKKSVENLMDSRQYEEYLKGL